MAAKNKTLFVLAVTHHTINNKLLILCKNLEHNYVSWYCEIIATVIKSSKFPRLVSK